MKCITETNIEVYFPHLEDDAIYDLECYDGYAKENAFVILNKHQRK